jgi:hypothetical protein
MPPRFDTLIIPAIYRKAKIRFQATRPQRSGHKPALFHRRQSLKEADVLVRLNLGGVDRIVLFAHFLHFLARAILGRV